MSHIVIDARQYTTSTGRYMFRLLQNLEKIDTKNDYTVLLKPQDMDVYTYTNPRFHKIPCPHKEFTFDEQIGLLNQIHGLKPDLVHFGIVQQPILYHGRTVTTMHDLTTVRFRNPSKNAVVFTIKQQVYKQVNKIAARKSDAIITPTKFVKQDVIDFTGVNPDKVTVTLESADAISDKSELVAGLKGQPFIMYIGRPMTHKNLDRLLQAFKILKETHPKLHLVLAGKKDALYEKYEQMAKHQGIDNVVFTGFISEGQLRWLYENTRAYIVPSLSEGFGLPGLEAMKNGAPVVSSNATCLPEVYGSAARYFDPYDTDDMAAQITKVLDDKKLRRELIEKGRAQAGKYSWERMARKTLAVYEKVLRHS